MLQLTSPKFQAFDSNGDFLVGGKLYVYIAGTSSEAVTFSNIGKTTENTNPIILDARGECEIYGNGPFKFYLTNANDALVWEVDYVYGSSVDFSYINVKVYGAIGDGTVDDTDAIQSAIDDAMDTSYNTIQGDGYQTVYFPAGTYKLSDSLTVNGAGVRLMGDGPGSTVLYGTIDDPVLDVISSGAGTLIDGMYIVNDSAGSGNAGIKCTNSNGIFLHNLWAIAQYCYYFQNCTDIIASNIVGDNGVGKIFYCPSGYNSYRFIVNNLLCWGFNGGIDVYGLHDSTFSNISGQFQSDFSARFVDCSNINLQGNFYHDGTTEPNGLTQSALNDLVQFVTCDGIVVDGTFKGSGLSAIYAESCTDVNIRGVFNGNALRNESFPTLCSDIRLYNTIADVTGKFTGNTNSVSAISIIGDNVVGKQSITNIHDCNFMDYTERIITAISNTNPIDYVNLHDNICYSCGGGSEDDLIAFDGITSINIHDNKFSHTNTYWLSLANITNMRINNNEVDGTIDGTVYYLAYSATLSNTGGTTTAVINGLVTSDSIILMTPTSANAAAAFGSAAGVYVSTITPGTSFTVVHPASPGAAATFNYLIIDNP